MLTANMKQKSHTCATLDTNDDQQAKSATPVISHFETDDGTPNDSHVAICDATKIKHRMSHTTLLTI